MSTHTSRLVEQVRDLVPRAVAGLAPEAELLARFVGHRDEDAFAALVARHGPMVLAAARRVLRAPDAAEDVAQATFLVLARRAYSIRRPEALAAWLYKTARQLDLMQRRAETRRRHYEHRSPPALAPQGPLDE